MNTFPYEKTPDLLQDLFKYAKDFLKFDKSVGLSFVDEPENAGNVLGKTGYYDPEKCQITLYITGRHPKDILRSFSHELVHHSQNCRGEFNREMTAEEGYAQNDKHLREMEREAYERGNLLLRDWEDKLKTEKKQMDRKKLEEEVRKALQKTGLLKPKVEEVVTEEPKANPLQEAKEREERRASILASRTENDRVFKRLMKELNKTGE